MAIERVMRLLESRYQSIVSCDDFLSVSNEVRRLGCSASTVKFLKMLIQVLLNYNSRGLFQNVCQERAGSPDALQGGIHEARLYLCYPHGNSDYPNVAQYPRLAMAVERSKLNNKT